MNKLFAYLSCSLSKSNMKWLGERLIENSKKEDYYNSEQFYKDLDTVEKDIENGNYKTVSNPQELKELMD